MASIPSSLFLPSQNRRETRASYEFYSLAVFNGKRTFPFCLGKLGSFWLKRLNFTSLATDLRNRFLKNWRGNCGSLLQLRGTVGCQRPNCCTCINPSTV